MSGLDGGHLIELLIAAITFYGIAWGFHRQDKADRQRKDEVQEELAEQRHSENREAIKDLTSQIRIHPLHTHTERGNQPLTANGIWPRQKP